MLLIFCAAALPAIVLFWFVYSKDISPEPGNLVMKGFFFGALATLVSSVFSGPMMAMGVFTNNPSSLIEAAKTAFFGAAIPEETAKLIMLWLLLRHCKDFDERYDGLVYAAAVGLGFATLENLLYLLSSGFSFFQVAVSRAFLAVPGHFAFAIVMGYYYSKQHFSWNAEEKRGAAWKMWAYPVLLHGIYDTICFASGLESVSVFWSTILTLALFWFCWRMFVHTRNRIIAEAASNNSENGFYAKHRDFYRNAENNFFGRDMRHYYYPDGDDSVDEQ